MISTASEPTTAVSTVNDCDAKLVALYGRMNVGSEKPAAANGNSSNGTATAAPVSFDALRPSDDFVILTKAKELPSRDKFSRLWAGDLGEVGGDHSKGDYALVGMLAYLTGPDEGRIDRLFRQSGLCRDKWTEREDYRNETIARAIKNRKVFFDWGKKPSKQAAKRKMVEEEAFGNSTVTEGPDGSKAITPVSLKDIAERLREVTATPNHPIGWPCRVRRSPFVPNQAGGVDWLTTPSAFFGWAKTKLGLFDWKRGSEFVSQQEFFAELCRTVEGYESVELVPHCPPMPATFYAWTPPKGDGSALEALLNRLAASDFDRDLIRAFLATLVWGGAGGLRPAFVITSDAGRGAGKTTLVKLAGLIVGGLMMFSQSESAAEIATRLLSSEGLGCRLVLIDNVKSRNFSWAELEALITAPVISGKRLYEGEGRRPNTVVWAITLNGASLSKDLAQRCVIVKIDAPSRSALWEEEVTSFIVKNRAAIIGDLLSFFDIQPEAITKPSRWASWERSVLARLSEPAVVQNLITTRQGEADVESDECDAVEEHFRTRLTELKYNAEVDRVHIGTQRAAVWYREATGEAKSPVGVTRIVGQLAKEGVYKRLSVDPSRTHGRGLLWSPEGAVGDVESDIEKRIEAKRLENLEDEGAARAEGAARVPRRYP